MVNIYNEDLTKLGFKKVDTILHPDRTNEEGIIFLGQDKPLWVKFIIKQRFNHYVVVNHRNEIYIYVDGFMSGGLEISKNTEKFLNDQFNNDRKPKVIKALKEIITELNGLT